MPWPNPFAPDECPEGTYAVDDVFEPCKKCPPGKNQHLSGINASSFSSVAWLKLFSWVQVLILLVLALFNATNAVRDCTSLMKGRQCVLNAQVC